jgi:hypothetical protein
MGFRSLPTSVVMVRKIDDWRLAFSILIPSDFAYEGQKFWEIPLSPGGELNLTNALNFRETLSQYGVSAAKPIGKGYSLGLSVYAQQYTYLSSIAGNGITDGLIQVVVNDLIRTEVSSFALQVMAGALKEWDHWNIGLRINLPGIHLFGSGSYYQNLYSSADNSLSEVREDELEGQFLSPFEVAIGTVYHPGERWRFALDLTFRGVTEFSQFTDYEGGGSVDYSGNLRTNTGFEYLGNGRLGYYLGGNYTPQPQGTPEGEAYLSFLGGYGGLKLFTEHLETSVGIFYTRGYGESPLTVGEGVSQQFYEYFGLFLGSNYRF